MKIRFKNGKRSTMTEIEQAFARSYDRLRKRAQREADPSYYEGARDALDTVADSLQRIHYLARDH